MEKTSSSFKLVTVLLLALLAVNAVAVTARNFQGALLLPYIVAAAFHLGLSCTVAGLQNALAGDLRLDAALLGANTVYGTISISCACATLR